MRSSRRHGAVDQDLRACTFGKVLVQHILRRHRSEQSEANRRVFRKFDDEEVKMVVFVHVDDILAHAQATMEWFAAELGETFTVKSMVEKFGVEKTSKTPASSGVSALSPS